MFLFIYSFIPFVGIISTYGQKNIEGSAKINKN